jgi:predicted O-linked N-acetylglucosamine transferase (SPINDLY family)
MIGAPETEAPHEADAARYLADGRLEMAGQALDSAAGPNRARPGIHVLMARLLLQRRNPAAAATAARRAQVADPQCADGHSVFLAAAVRTASRPEVERMLARAFASAPGAASLFATRAVARRHATDARRAILLEPASAQWLGLAAQIEGRTGSATVRRMLICAPSDAAGLTLSLAAAGETSGPALRRAAVAHPGRTPIWSAAADGALRAQRLQDAADFLARAHVLDPGNAMVRSGRMAVRARLGRAEIAPGEFRALARDAGAAEEVHLNLAAILARAGRLVDADRAARRAVTLRPDRDAGYGNLGAILKDLGDPSATLRAYDRARLIAPALGRWDENRLFALNYDPTVSDAMLSDAYRAFGRRAGTATAARRHPRRASDGRLRIGYVSPDFRGHVCRFFIEPVFANHDRARVHLTAYSNVVAPDTHTERLKGYFDGWVDTAALSDAELADRIAADGIDVLVDLAGHTVGNRLGAFALRPAPVQVSYLGFGFTTGLSQIDYFIADDTIVPAADEALFAETVWRLPSPHFPYSPPLTEIPDVAPAPSTLSGRITFGSLTRVVRLNDSVLRAWARILERVAGSRLRLDQRPFSDPATRAWFLDRAERLGLPRERIDLSFSAPHWSAYHGIDIGLDCWPHNAGTTTFESLLMGVPVVTLRGRAAIGRLGAAILQPVADAGWIADTVDDYVDAAVAAAQDPDRLAAARTTLRGNLLASPWTDAATVTAHLEAAFADMAERARTAA